MALWDRRVFPRPLLLDVWSVDQELSASGELDRNADAKPSLDLLNQTLHVVKSPGDGMHIEV